ncbi:MAG: hypothetical protein ACXV2A_05635 [Halobacteriota archaeon]
MSQYGSRISTNQQELRISTLEKRQAQRQADAENAAPILSCIRLEGPSDVVTIFEEAVSLVRNATTSQDAAKGRALAYIAAKGVEILPLVEAAKAQAEDWEKIRREQEVIRDICSEDPQAGQVIADFIELQFKIEEEAEKRYRAKLMSEREFSPASEEKEGRNT